jgi:exonuclease VII small subunit
MQAPTITAPERGNLHCNHNTTTNGQAENGNTRSAFKAALEHIERVKTNLRDVISDLSDAMTMLKTAEKEQRVSAKEIQTVRAKLKEIQNVEI